MRFCCSTTRRTTKCFERRLRLEPLESRCLLSAVSGSGVFHVYVEPGLQAGIQRALNVYVADLSTEGYQVGVREFAGDAAALRAELQTQWMNNSLEGALLVGDLPHLMFTSTDNFGSSPTETTYPHDLYFMDLDGTYVLTSPGKHLNGAGDVGPEIYVSRITTGNLDITGKDEAALINDYFAKVHAYRAGDLRFADRGIVFADDNWSSWGQNEMDDLYGEVWAINSTAETTPAGYLDALSQDYESILECLHAGPQPAQEHEVKVGAAWPVVTNTDILQANPRQGFYNMFNCSGARFTSPNHLIGTYVYGGDYGLNAVGSTKTGGMLEFPDFYLPQGAGDSVGRAFMKWFDLYAFPTDSPLDDWRVDWHYGMTMQGDPTLRPAIMGDGPSGMAIHTVENVLGTEGDDTLEVVAGATPEQWTVLLNGVEQTIAPVAVELNFDGLGGNDTVLLTATGGNDNLELRPNHGILSFDKYTISATNVESITVDGVDGNDTAGLYDSHGDDLFVAAPGYGRLTGDGFSLQAISFHTVNAYATGGGRDVARMYDSAGDDVFHATPVEATLYPSGDGDEFFCRAKYFEEVHGFSPAGGCDAATLFGSAGDDVFSAGPLEATMRGQSGGGTDARQGYCNRVKQIEHIRGDASQGGNDLAVLFDSDRVDSLEAATDQARLSNDLLGFLYEVLAFDRVNATATTEGDTKDVTEPLDFVLSLQGPWHDTT